MLIKSQNHQKMRCHFYEICLLVYNLYSYYFFTQSLPLNSRKEHNFQGTVVNIYASAYGCKELLWLFLVHFLLMQFKTCTYRFVI